MDSASPVATCAAGKPTVESGTSTFANGTVTFFDAEFTLAFTFDWLSGRSAGRVGRRDAHHRSAPGEAAA